MPPRSLPEALGEPRVTTMTREKPYEEQVRSWSIADLLDVAAHIDEDAFPDRHRIIRAELNRRRTEPTLDASPPPVTPPRSKYDTFLPRVGANLLDGLILVPIGILAQYLSATLSGPVLQATPNLVANILFYMYSIILHSRNGQTLGKMAAHVRVLDVSESKLSLYQAIIRDIVPLSLTVASFLLIVFADMPTTPSEITLSSLAPFIFLGSISSLWSFAEVITLLSNKKRRAVHDFIAGSVVVRVA